MPNEVLQRPASQNGIGLPRALVRLARARPLPQRRPLLHRAVHRAVVVVGTAANMWPLEVPSALLFPVVVAAGVARLRPRPARGLRADPRLPLPLDAGRRS